VLPYEARVVDALSTSVDPGRRAAVADWVDGSLRAMPELLRAGVAMGSILLGAWASATGKRGDDLIRALETSPVPPVRQHLRLLRSLVVFGDVELGSPTT
jgi:hypothetical protein